MSILHSKPFFLLSLFVLLTIAGSCQTYKIVDPAQVKCFDTLGGITCPAPGQTFYGQDAEFSGNMPDYNLNPDGKTVYDNMTGLTWMRSPNMTNTPPVFFHCTPVTNEAGQPDFPYYWSGTTHEGYSTTSQGGGEADYVSFGRALGWPTTQNHWVDVHGAGCQRSDPKVGPPNPFATVHTVIVNGMTYTGYTHRPREMPYGEQTMCGWYGILVIQAG